MKNRNNRTNVMVKVVLYITAFFTWYMNNGIYVLAGNIGEKAGEWVLDQIFWAGVVIIGIVLASCLLKRAWVAAAITVIAGGIILFFIDNAEILSDLGASIYQAIFG